MPPMCRASNPEIYSSQFRIFTNIVLCFLHTFFCFVEICLLITNVFISSRFFFSFKNNFANSKIWMINSSCRNKHVKNEKMLTKKKELMVGNFQVNARAGGEVLAPLGPGSPQPRCSRRPLQEVLSGVGVEFFCVCVISV